MKKTSIFLASLSAIFFVGFLVAHAQEYTPLAPLPLGPAGETLKTYTLSTYLAGAIKLIIALGAGFSILLAIVAGVQRVASGISPAAKQGANERLTNALVGLALILTSYLILNSINPDLVTFKWELPPIVNPKPIDTSGGPSGGATWPDDSAIRSQITNAGVGINKSNCTAAGQTSCTSVAELPSSAVNGVINLKNNCNCAITITGGTEDGHQTHGRGIPMIDLRAGGALDSFITKGNPPVNPQSGCGLVNAAHYNTLGGTYVLELVPSIHWHVCY